MTRFADLNSLIVDNIADAERDPARMQDLIACLVAGIGLAVAIATDGKARLANDLCEVASASIFEASTEQALRLTTARGRA